jgi:hypothetical protein
VGVLCAGLMRGWVCSALDQDAHRKPGERALLTYTSLNRAWRTNLLLMVPALLYAINNYLKFAMQLFFKPATVKMLGNLKVGVLPLPVALPLLAPAERSRALPPHRPRADGLSKHADTSRSDLAAALGLLSRWR